MTAGRPPLVSVIVLNLNGEEVLKRCMDALVAQTYPNFEIIVVDNGSTDSSLSILDPYLGCDRVSVVRSPGNRGCAGGRNLGLRYAAGEIVAFIDNDGYAAPDWLARAIERLLESADIGAVASLVFFARHPLIVNGAGGALNWQGYGLDHQIQTPYEFADLPRDVAYPMGCGMVVRRDVFDRCGPLDDILPNYYDDVEVGLRVRKLGLQVVLADLAWIDHEFNFTSRFVADKFSLSERGRIRTVLKYFPASRLLQWAWHELGLIARDPARRGLIVRAWAWNLRHVFSTLAWRWKLRRWTGDVWSVLSPGWGRHDVAVIDNRAFVLEPGRAGPSLTLDAVSSRGRLNFGWHAPAQDGPRPFRWTSAQASAVFYLPDPAARCEIEWIPAARQPQTIRLMVRYVAEAQPVLVHDATTLEPGWRWQTYGLACSLSPGWYEVVLISQAPFVDDYGSLLGAAVSTIRFV